METNKPYQLGKFSYYANICGFDDLKVIPWQQGTDDYHNFSEGFNDAYCEQSRYRLRMTAEQLADWFGIKDYEKYLINAPIV